MVFGIPEFDYNWDGVLIIKCTGLWTRGLPIRVNKSQISELNKQLDELYDKDVMQWLEKQVDVVRYDGHDYILSDSGSARIACNLIGKLICAKSLGCDYTWEKGRVRWQGQRQIHIPDP